VLRCPAQYYPECWLGHLPVPEPLKHPLGCNIANVVSAAMMASLQ
jgi:hypothetical protein